MKKILILGAVMLISISQTAFGWGRVGHDAVAYIAECNLTKKAKKNIEKYLDHSIVYYASWMDDYRETPLYKHTTVWHTAAVDKDGYYTDAVRRSTGDVVCELENAIEVLRDYKNLDDSTVIVNLKYVIHMVGDMHCPGHVKYADIKTNFDVELYGKKVSYHTVWDSNVLEQPHKWYYKEWQHQLDRCSKKEKKAIAAGTLREWFHENAVDSRVIYELAQPGSKLGKDFMNTVHPIAERQILRAGYRLASILNQLFG